MVGQARRDHAVQGQLPFIICWHYGYTSQITFYLPEAKQQVQADPFVFLRLWPYPVSQFYYWPTFLDRKGQNAIYVSDIEKPRFRPDWFSRWWNHREDLYLDTPPEPSPPPPEVSQHFSSTVDLGIHDVVVDGKIVRRFQLFELRNLH